MSKLKKDRLSFTYPPCSSTSQYKTDMVADRVFQASNERPYPPPHDDRFFGIRRGVKLVLSGIYGRHQPDPRSWMVVSGLTKAIRQCAVQSI